MYTFIAIAPCSFNISGKAYVLTAGKTLRVQKAVGERIRSNTFKYHKYLRLVNIEESDLPKKEEPKKEEPKKEPVAKEQKGVVVPQVKTTKVEPTILEAPKEEPKEEPKEDKPKRRRAYKEPVKKDEPKEPAIES